MRRRSIGLGGYPHKLRELVEEKEMRSIQLTACRGWCQLSSLCKCHPPTLLRVLESSVVMMKTMTIIHTPEDDITDNISYGKQPVYNVHFSTSRQAASSRMCVPGEYKAHDNKVKATVFHDSYVVRQRDKYVTYCSLQKSWK